MIKFNSLWTGNRFTYEGETYIKIDPLLEQDRIFGESSIEAINLNDGSAKQFYGHEEVSPE